MATDGLSLVGFMEEAQAINFLRNNCKQDDSSDTALKTIWQQATAKLGAPIGNAGKPDIQNLSKPELDGLMSQELLRKAIAETYPGSTYCRVEIDPLLAYQFSVDMERSDHHCNHVNTESSFDELAKFCLPTTRVHEPVQQFTQDQSALVKSRSLNMRLSYAGIFTDANGPTAMGFNIVLSMPIAHVVRFNGRCYLHNGFHRSVGLRKAGITHIPCLLRDVPDAASAGIAPPGTFAQSLLESANPPTLAHYTSGLAWPVKLRATSRILHVSWSDYIVYDE